MKDDLTKITFITSPSRSDQHTSLYAAAVVSCHTVTWQGFEVCYLLYCYSECISLLNVCIMSASPTSGDPCCVLLDLRLAYLNQIHADWCWQKQASFWQVFLVGCLTDGQMVTVYCFIFIQINNWFFKNCRNVIKSFFTHLNLHFLKLESTQCLLIKKNTLEKQLPLISTAVPGVFY